MVAEGRVGEVSLQDVAKQAINVLFFKKEI